MDFLDEVHQLFQTSIFPCVDLELIRGDLSSDVRLWRVVSSLGRYVKGEFPMGRSVIKGALIGVCYIKDVFDGVYM